MHNLFEMQRNCLRLMGHNFENEKLQRFRKWNTFRYVASLLLVISAQWPMMQYLIYHSDDLTLVTATLSICFTNTLTTIKISTFLLYRPKFINLMKQLEEMYEKLQEPTAKKLLIAANGIAMKLVKLYFLSVRMTGLYFMIAPAIKIIWANVMHKEIIRELPMPMRFYFDYESSPGYEFAYIYTGFVTFTVVMYATAIDGLFLSCTINLRGHFQSLQYFIASHEFRKNNKEIEADMRMFIQYHNLLLKLSNHVRRIYKPIVFGQFLITSLQVCVIIYQLVTHMTAMLVLMVYCTFLSAIMLQLFIYCYGGEILKNESAMVGTAVQLSPWYNLKPQHRLMLGRVLQRSQRAIIIRAVFYEASLANFMSILRAALSYITLIQSIE